MNCNFLKVVSSAIVDKYIGESARVIRVTESKEEVTVELFEAAVPVALTVRADQVRVTQRVE